MSATKITKISRASLAWGILLIAAGLLLSVTQARAETDKGRNVIHNIKVEEMEVGDVPGHVLGVVENKGLTFYENGEVATLAAVVMFDNINGIGPYQGYVLRTFEDGSTQFFKIKGTDMEKGLFKGTYTYVRGTGRFQRIKGGGTFSGKEFGEAGLYVDFTGTYTLP